MKRVSVRYIINIFVLALLLMYLCGCGSEAETTDDLKKQPGDSVIVVENDISKPAGAIALEINPDEKSEEIPEVTEVSESAAESDDEEPVAETEDEVIPEEIEEEETNTESQEETAGGPDTGVSDSAISLNPGWVYADHSAINSGAATMYRATGNRKNVVIGVNAGHGTKGGQSVKTLCHPDGSPKVTGGSTAEGSTKAAAVSGGMTFLDGTSEAAVTLREAQILRDKLLANGYDVLMLRDGSDVQLDNVARTIIANNTANCLISLHWDGDNLNYDKGCFYISTPDALKGMEPVASNWTKHEQLGKALIEGLRSSGCKINGKGSMAVDLTQTSYSTIPSVDIELGNAASAHDDATLGNLADGLVSGIGMIYN